MRGLGPAHLPLARGGRIKCGHDSFCSASCAKLKGCNAIQERAFMTDAGLSGTESRRSRSSRVSP